jgi:anaerobic magnesium-protoporphyrin IX monomethyl ester cyclase
MLKITLVYPYLQPRNDNSQFRFPPLGLGYIASALKRKGFHVELVDCTFLGKEKALERIVKSDPQIIGIYSMFSMKKTSLELASLLREKCELLVTGGPLPTLDPEDYLDIFDLAVIGEGEETMVEIAEDIEQGLATNAIKGVAYKENGKIKYSQPREFIKDLDSLKFPARDLFDNTAYKQYYQKHFNYTTAPLMSSRGCPFSCDFCSHPVFGTLLRLRSPENIVAEVQEIANLGYDRVWFADDCFTLNAKHLRQVCNLLIQRQIDIGWECLSRADTLTPELANNMKKAGCIRVFFGAESGNDTVLGIMNKQITAEQTKRAVYVAKEAGLQVGAFFIVGYPGENNQTLLDTLRFASRLPLDYLSFTMPYPIPGTPLHERMKQKCIAEVDDWEEPKNLRLIKHKLLYESGFSERKLKLAIGKAILQFRARRFLGNKAYAFIEPMEKLTDTALELIR